MPKRTRIKICGITRSCDAIAAVEAGVDALGFVFVQDSSRYLPVASAAQIANALPPFVSRVGLFLNHSRTEVQQVLDAIPDCMPQFHGNESAEFCDSFERPYIKAVSVTDGIPDAETLTTYTKAVAFLFDSHALGKLGGTGKTFDWDLLSGLSNIRVILAGGLNESNVQKAIRQVRPYAVDLSSGVEVEKGIKDATKIQILTELVYQT